MKYFTFCIAFFSLACASFSQAPQAFNYQAILRNSDGTSKANETISLQVNIVNDQGISSYLEIHNTQTNEFGMVNVVIGEGTSSDDLATVDWANGPFFLEIIVNGTLMGTSPLLSVPLALYALKSGVDFNGDFNDLSGVPLEFTPIDHTHFEGEIVDLHHYTDNDINGDETAFEGWDKNKNDDFAGDMNNGRIVNVANPVDPQDAATKAYVDELQQQIQNLQNSILQYTGELWQTDSSGIFKDQRDNEVYSFIVIGDQVWMDENLAYLPNVSPSSEKSPSEQYFYVYDYHGTNVSEAKATHIYQTYGVLYNWPASMAVCPDGWHLPTDTEWIQLEMYLGMSQSEADNVDMWRGTDEGDKLKSQIGWDFDDNAKNESGFTALPGGGLWSVFGEYNAVGEGAEWWSSTEIDSVRAYNRLISSNSGKVFRYMDWKRMGYSVRCIKDQ